MHANGFTVVPAKPVRFAKPGACTSACHRPYLRKREKVCFSRFPIIPHIEQVWLAYRGLCCTLRESQRP